MSPEELSGAPNAGPDATTHGPVMEPMNKNKLKHVSECFTDIAIDGKRGIGKVTIEKLTYFLE
jgi:hypothetical protein